MVRAGAGAGAMLRFRVGFAVMVSLAQLLWPMQAVADSGPEGWSAQMDSQGQYWLVSELSEALHIDESNPMLELGVKRLSAPHGRSSHRTSPRRSGAPAGFLEKIPTLGT